MIGVVVRKAPEASRDDDQGSPQRARLTALVAVNGVAEGRAPPASTHSSTRDSSVHTKGRTAAGDAVRNAQRPSAGTLPAERSASSALDDPSLVVPVIASPEDVLRARALRQQLRKQYLDRPGRPCLPWCVGAD